MGQEIERKFLVKGEFRPLARKSYRICQGYICTEPAHTVRVRIRDGRGFLTIKGESDKFGVSRFEWEKEIPVDEAENLMALCGPGVIDKVRYLVDFARHTFEVDEFHGANEGLVMAELELTAEDEAYERPSWLGEEVTGDVRYYNSWLSTHPYSEW